MAEATGPDKLYTFQVLHGLDTNRSLLSCTPDGTKCELASVDDGSGRQKWKVVGIPGFGIKCYIIVSGGTKGRTYLSCNEDGTLVDLWERDDRGGRQVWDFAQLPGPIKDYYHISMGALPPKIDRRFLSCSADGRTVDLWSGDDGSGRQRWQVPGLPWPPP
jgi:hypothetical protein